MAKPTKWFKAVKKAFRSPSKERPPPDQSPKADQGDEKQQLLTKHDFPPQAHPLPLFEIISLELVQGQPQNVPLPQSPIQREEKQVLEHEEETDDDGDSAFSEEEEEEDEEVDEEEASATTIQQRFLTIPLALKGLVRLQALVRGHLVRRQAATTLRTMEAIVRVQAVFRGRRVRMSLKDGRAVRNCRTSSHSSRGSINGVVHDEDKVEIVVSEEEASKRKRSTSAHLITQQVKRTTPNYSSSFTDCDANHPQNGWAWLELWTKTRPWDHNNTRQGGDSDSGKDSYIEINPNHSQYYTTKEVDVNTKVKYYEDYISDLAPKKTNFSSRLMKKELGVDWQAKSAHKPLQIEVPDAKEEDQKVSMMATSSYSLSEGHGFASPHDSDAASVRNASPQGSDAASACHVPENGSPQGLDAAASVCHVPETPLVTSMVEFGGGHEPSCEGVAMEQFVLHVQGSNGGADPALSDSLSVSNGVHLQGEDHALGLASDDAVNGHTSNGHGDDQLGKEEIHVTPASKSRGVTCRYMAATKSAEAKFRSSSNSKLRTTPETPESSPTITKRYSTGSSRQATNQSPKLVARKSNNRRSPSPVTVSKDLSPAKRNSLGGDGKRWRT